ncbi:MAG: thiamine phosphate synthase [Deltaproteobacteria bacterium]|nr:thiamine phosphate synthase [Deltaproteobacteria bacterium]
MGVNSGNIKGLYAIIDTAYVAPEGMRMMAEKIIKGGAGILQLRSKGLSSREMLDTAWALREVTLKNGVIFIINDRADIAALVQADGVHLGQDDLPAADARKLLGEGSIIGVSTHNKEEAAACAHADYISFGPVFPTKTKKDAQAPKGLSGLKEVRGATPLPIVAIGGITEENIGSVIAAGADSAAIISDILLSGDVPSKVASIIRVADKRKI